MTISIPALLPRAGPGHQFVVYADSCSGRAGAPHEQTFAAVNAVVSRIRPVPEFICFPGDEIAGLIPDDDLLRGQWQHWFDREMAWLDRNAIPLYHTTGNHTTFDAASERVFQQVMSHLPRNGPRGQEGLSYFVRRGDLLMLFVNTCWSGLGGEGRVESAWLDQTLQQHADAHHKLVLGHHPVFTVNGFAGPFQRDIEAENGRAFWQVLVRHRVLAYVCSHILAFDVQAHDGVLQIVTAGAGTAHRMPAEHEYLHCVQAALDADGLRYQVLDTSGTIREWLEWPFALGPSADWSPLRSGENVAPWTGEPAADPTRSHVLAFSVSGIPPAGGDSVRWVLPTTHAEAGGHGPPYECRSEPTLDGRPQTILTACDQRAGAAPLWIGLTGPEQRLTVLMSPSPGRSPHQWYGPCLPAGLPFELQLAIHTGMGPGGILWRSHDEAPWNSLAAASPWGAERLCWPAKWLVGSAQRGPADRPFRGKDLQIAWSVRELNLPE